MNVLIVCGIYTDGITNTASQFVHHGALALKKRGINVTVLSLDTRSIRRKRKFGVDKYVIDEIPVYVGSFPCGPLGEILKYISKTLAAKVFKRIVKEQGLPDIIHAHFYYNAYAVIDIAKKHDIPLITTEHSSTTLNININEKIKKDAEFVYSNSDKVICVSNGLKASIKEFYSGNIEVINNIVSNDFYYENTLKPDEYTFVSTGNLLRLKRHDLTISAFAKFNKIHPNSKLVIIGTGDKQSELINLAKQLYVSDNVEFKGKIENKKLIEIYKQCHCFVLPSEYETFGVAYIEAIAAGLPVISGVHAQKNGIVNDENGIAVSENTVDNVYSVMVNIYNNYDEYDKEKMSQDIIEKYKEEKIVGEIIKTYSNLLV